MSEPSGPVGLPSGSLLTCTMIKYGEIFISIFLSPAFSAADTDRTDERTGRNGIDHGSTMDVSYR